MEVGARHKIIIAIDGYSSCGKSTLAKALAKKLHYNFIDSGAMYRAVTYFILQNKISVEQLHAMIYSQMQIFLDKIKITFHVNRETGASEVFLNGENVETFIREMKVSEMVSAVSAIPAIRHRMVKKQQGYGKLRGVVMDGRDIGTTVFPDADLKIFMTARNDVRAKRRFDELKSKGINVTMEEILKNIESRDYADTHRAESPLKKADDAILLDNSDMTEQQQFDFALEQVRKMDVDVPA